MSADPVRITARTNLQSIASRVALTDAPQAPLYAAVAAGRIGLVVIENHTTPWPDNLVLQPRRPVVVLVGGDPGWGEPSFGPTLWRCAKPLKAWASAAIVHGAAGEPDHYRNAVALAQMFDRLAFIETNSGLARMWSAFLELLPWMGYLPEKGAHPVAPTVRN